MTSDYSRGSEWRRWDLHIHTPESALNNNFPDWDSYLDKLEEFGEEIAAVGVTDYVSIEGYKRLRSEKAGGRLPGIKEFFPNIEFRITPETRKGKGINIHIIADPKDDAHIQYIEEALSRLSFEYDGQPYSCTSAGLTGLGRRILEDGASSEACFREGVNQFKPSFDKVKTWYDSEGWLKQNSLIVAANGSNDGISGLQHDDGLRATREKIYQFAEGVFSATPNDREYFLGKGVDSPEVVVQKYGSLKPCIHGSDAHELDKLFKPDEDRFCWIKADVTFDGLKQICFEPEARVRIQATSPKLDFRKPYFNSLKLKGSVMAHGLPEFEETEIPLNPGMVTLVGGRGTGKSLLLDCIYKLFNKHKIQNSDDRLNKINPNEFEVAYEKYDSEKIEYRFGGDADLDYLHVKQGDIKRVADSAEGLSREIKELLKISALEEKPEYDFEISTIISRIEKALAWFELTDSEGAPINNKEKNEEVIAKNKNLVATITTGENKDSIEQFQKNNQEINTRKTITNKLSELKTKLITTKVEVNREIEEVNVARIDGIKLTPITFDSTDSEIKVADESLQKSINEFVVANKNIEEQFKALGIDQDVGGLLEKLSQYQKEIDLAEEKISEYESKNLSIESDIQERTNLVTKIEEDLETKKENINTKFSQIKAGKTTWTSDQKALVEALLNDISIEGEISFDLKRFYKGLGELLNGKKFRSSNGETQEEKIKSKFNVSSYGDYLRLIRNESIIDDGEEGYISLNEFAVQKDYFLKFNFNIYEYLYLFSYRKNYLAVNPIIEYQGKSPDKLSVGQRGTFFVCMKLATDPFGSPFIFDQPEDDLDNKFIMRELVPLFRGIKKYRQVIIATHNANLVVNADAEQVIVASNNGERLSYFSGSLEHTSSIEPLGIRENVCDILEGGQTAFESREKKYGFGS